MNSLAKITAQGSYVPEKIMDNQDFEEIVETSDEWIQQRTGIVERRITKEDEYTSDISYKAVLDLQEKYQVDLSDVDMIINATLTPDYKTPSVASYVQAKIGLTKAGAIDINAACAGFTYGLNLANGLITSGQNKKILVIGAETLSKITDYTDRSTCILFGDGAGAFLVEYSEDETSFIASSAGSDGDKGHNLYCSELSEEMFSDDLENPGYIVQNGRGVYKWAVGNVPKVINETLEKTDYNIEDLDWFVPHSANARMIESICEKSGIEKEKALMSLRYYGNTSSATIPLSMDLAMKENKLKKGDLILLVGFGGGLAYASTLIKWTI
ncbi:ketoacyl-ACP synthase III [Staphylococcus gallinarum]|uniref:ketoacyl-ACP synthase III n=1 Tax=Staphylococcus gallinarum TaxID=1293 RepID=UPI001E2AAF8B|nr:ketoacyl-ACP synthase III [Staphylococcus gallinarum]MCD8822435.1 ketoacyl-ACP synthase III [Staphylococcus gallinarum]